jgi:hypothetical protein
MFAKLARLSQFWMPVPGHAAPGPATLLPANDNAPQAHPASAMQSVGRPVLVCHWRRAGADGRLECRWRLQAPDGSAGGAQGDRLAQSQR